MSYENIWIEAAKQEKFDQLKVAFIITGVMDGPYLALERAVISGLQKVTNYVSIVPPGERMMERVAEIKPDLTIVFFGLHVMPEQVEVLRSFGKTVVWFTDDPYYSDFSLQIAPHYEYVFTQDIGCVSHYQQLGCNAFYLPLAVDPKVFRPMKVGLGYQSDICFLGSAFENRIALVDAIAPYLAKKDMIISGLWWNRLTQYSLLKDKIYVDRWMTPGETARYYSGTKIAINSHRPHDDSFNLNSIGMPAHSINNRTFEISSCNIFQLSDVRPDLTKFYILGSEIEIYENPLEMAQKIEYYLQNEAKRKEIALNGYRRTLRDNTYVKRIYDMFKIIFP